MTELASDTCLMLVGEPRTWNTPNTLPAFDPFIKNPVFQLHIHGKIDIVFCLKKSLPKENMFQYNLLKTNAYYYDEHGDLHKNIVGEYDCDVVEQNIMRWKEKFSKYINKLEIIWQPDVGPEPHTYRRYLGFTTLHEFYYKGNYLSCFITRPDILLTVDPYMESIMHTMPYGITVDPSIDRNIIKKPTILFSQNSFLNNTSTTVSEIVDSQIRINNIIAEFICINHEFYRLLHQFLDFYRIVHNHTNMDPKTFTAMDLSENFWSFVTATFCLMSGEFPGNTNANIIVGQMLIKPKTNTFDSNGNDIKLNATLDSLKENE